MAARFRPRNDIEVDGRKLCGTGGFFDGPTLFYQGTVLIDLDLELLAGALRHPFGKLDRRGLASIGERVTTLTQLLGRAPPLDRVVAAVSDALAGSVGRLARSADVPAWLEEMAAEHLAEEVGTDAFVLGEPHDEAGEGYRVGEHRASGGTVRAHLRLRPGEEPVIDDVWFEGDFFLTPARAVRDLEAALRGTRTTMAEPRIAAFFAQAPEISSLGIGPAELTAAVSAALDGGARA
ncbi:MAG: hypothetical protein M3N56_10345 [Actinomycetota bacterium]|nr:hypothetical protein [Actinomycetota bacterium]